MYIVLCSLLAIAQEPTPSPKKPTVTEEKKMDVTAEMRVMVPKDGFIKANKDFSVILSLQNNTSKAAVASINEQTAQTTLTIPNGTTQAVSIPWSTKEASIEANNSFAVFGRIALSDPGTYTLRFWWAPNGSPSKEPTQTIDLVVQ